MKQIFTAAVIAALALSAPANAQTEGAIIDDPADQGTPGETYTKSTHGDWELQCVRVAEGREPCQLYQLLRDGNDNAVAEFGMFSLPEGQQAIAGANITTPLETLLTEQLRLGIDGGAGKVYPFSFCTASGCLSRVGFLPEEVDAFRKGAEAQIIIVPAKAPNQQVILTLSLKGFTAGFEALVATRQ
jgi:invasion protein IalB